MIARDIKLPQGSKDGERGAGSTPVQAKERWRLQEKLKGKLKCFPNFTFYLLPAATTKDSRLSLNYRTKRRQTGEKSAQENGPLPWPVWLTWLGIALQSERLLIRFPGLMPGLWAWSPTGAHAGGNRLMFLFLSFSFSSSLSKNK